ncbi:MAG: hypothetical protein IPP44_14750 [Ideonella sp.]|nr:hypothetical protein [Ideonella sp.]
MKRSCWLLLLLLLFAHANANAHGAPPAAVPAMAAPPASNGLAVAGRALNLRHFDHLYADRVIAGREMAVVHIYAKHPDYRFDIEPNEGFTCVDDVARALVVLAREWQQAKDPELLRKIRRLTEFVLYLQNENGYFNNFLWGDLRINTDYKTSVAELNWWSLRALGGLEMVLPLLDAEPVLAARIRAATDRLVANLVQDLPNQPRKTTTVAGVPVPDWLPAGSGADQAAEAIIGLLPHLQRTGNAAARRLIETLADGLLLMQKGDAQHYPYGMFLSWRNTWHAWGNVQAYALLSAGERLQRKDYIASALLEIDNFYPHLLKTGLAEAIEIRAEGAAYVEVSRREFPQIAYGLRPMVFAALKAHALTGQAKYRALAEAAGAWFHGRNAAATAMVDTASGRVFDGIVGPGQVNRDSGAESTIEALLTLQALRDSR